MRSGIRRPRRFLRVALVADLSFLTLCAPLMIVCEGVEHSATEWIFSSA